MNRCRKWIIVFLCIMLAAFGLCGFAKAEEAGKNGTEDQDISSPAVCGKLSVEGTKLVDERGEAVVLRGLSTHGLASFPQYVNEEAFAQFRREWKANVIRLAMYTAEYGGYCTDGDREYLKDLVRNGVEYATRQDMYVIVDWHVLTDCDPNRYKEDAIEFFAQMSEEFSGHNNVLYEICNEPNGGTTWPQVKAYAEEVIPVIRANDPDAVILVGTPNWSQYVDQAAADPITGYDNIMYTLHFYSATHMDDLRNTMTAAVDAGLPVFVSEYGICDASGNGEINEEQANAWVQTLDRYGISYVAWNISNKNETSAIIKSTVEKTSGFSWEDLSDSGRWVYQTLTGGSGEVNAGENDGADAEADGESDSADAGADGESNGADAGTDGENAPASDGASQQGAAVISGDIEVTAVLVNQWESNGQHFYQYESTVKNISDQPCQSWEADVRFNGDIALSDGWNGRYLAEKDTLHISSMDYNGNLAPDGSTDNVGFIITGAADLKIQ